MYFWLKEFNIKIQTESLKFYTLIQSSRHELIQQVRWNNCECNYKIRILTIFEDWLEAGGLSDWGSVDSTSYESKEWVKQAPSINF